MTTTQKVFVAGLGLFCLISVGFGAYLEDKSSDRTIEPPTVIVPPPRPRPQHPLRQLIQTVQPGAPIRYRNLTLFPLVRRAAPGNHGIRTMDEALSHGWITISEHRNASIGELLVRNDSNHVIFLMAGEILKGGKQNRIIKQDVLLSAHSDFIAIPVYCGEKERWDTDHATFKSGKTVAEPGLRRMTAGSESQDAIWQKIDGRMSETEVASPTQNYQALYENRKTRRELDACVARFRHLCGRRTVGLVAVTGHRIIGCDLFSDPELLSRLWDKICRSYAVNTLGHDEHQKRRHDDIDARDIRHFLNNVFSSRLTHQNTPGSGEATRISGSVQGHALTWRSDVVHAALFPGITILRKEMHRPELYR